MAMQEAYTTISEDSPAVVDRVGELSCPSEAASIKVYGCMHQPCGFMLSLSPPDAL